MNIDFINECKKPSYCNRLGKILVQGNDTPLTEKNYLKNITIDSGCYVDGTIIGSIYITKMNAEFLSLPSDIELINKSLFPQIGVKYENGLIEYIDLGKFVVERPENLQSYNELQIISYNDIYNKIDSSYISNIDYSNNITIKDLYIDVCNQLGLSPKTIEFTNNNIPVYSNPFTNNESIRIVLQSIGKVACSFITIDPITNEIDLSWLSNNQEPDYIFYKEDYSILEGGIIQFGPVNSLSICNSSVEDENVSIKDDSSISLYGEHLIKISEDFLLYNAELRELAINNIFNRLNGLKYIDFNLVSYYGKPFLKIGDKVRIYIDEENYIDSYVLTHNFHYDGSFKSEISAPVLTEQEIATKQNISLGKSLRNTQIEVNKQKGEIKSTIEVVNNHTKQISQVFQDIDAIHNMFQVTGGNNLIKDSQLLLGDDVWEYGENEGCYYLGGYDANLVGKTVSTAKIGIKNGYMKTKSNNITDLVIGSQYALSFKISNDANTETTIRLIGNDVIYEKTFSSEENFHEEIFAFLATTSTYTLEIESSTLYDGYCYIYDLMLNKGDKVSWEPSNGEIVNTILKLSRLGLQIYCTGSEIATLMTSQGFQIRRFANNNLYEIVTEFTKDGFISKKGELLELNINTYDMKTISYQGYSTLILYKVDGDS